MADNQRHTPLQLDLYAILRSRLGKRKMRYIPRFLISGLERMICQRQLNEMLRFAFPARGSRFSEKILSHLDISLEVKGLDNIPDGGRYIFASNHPLGGLDGIALIAVLGKRYGDDGIRFLVNDMLMNVEPLTDVFLPINKYGSQGRRAAAEIAEAYSSDRQMIIFPAGLVSRLHDDGRIRDLDWQKAFVAKAIEYDREIIPVHFEALNRRRFYRLARLRKRLGIKVNLEQALLPSELVATRGKTFRITFGKPIPLSTLKEASPRRKAADIKEIAYSLA